MKCTLMMSLVLALAGSVAWAVPITGEFTSADDGILDGHWTQSELGAAGTKGDTLEAASFDGALAGQWELVGLVDAVDMIVGGPIPTGTGQLTIFTTTYDLSSADLILKTGGPWDGGDGIYTVSLDSFVQTTTVYTVGGELKTSTGQIALSGTFDAFGAYSVNFLSAESDLLADETGGAEFPALSGGASSAFFGEVTEVKMEIVPEPATMTLLAIGGLVAIKRRRR